MTTNTDNTIIAFLLAFQDLNTSLSAQEKQNLQEVAKQLDKSYKFYQSQLENLEKIPHNLLPNEAEVSSLINVEKVAITKGFKPNSEATGYERQLNNVVVIIGNSEKPEETVKQATFLGELKQYLTQSNPSN